MGGQNVLDGVRTFDGRSVMGDQDLRLELAQPVDALCPLHGVAVLRAAQRIDVGEGHALDGVGGDQHLFVGQPNDALVVRFAGNMHDVQPDAGDLDFEPVLEGSGGSYEAGLAAPGRGADRAAEGTGLAEFQMPAELIGAAATPDRRENALVAQQIIGQFGLGDNLHFALPNVLFGHETEDAADVIAVKMGDDHRLDRQVGDLAESRGRLVSGEFAAQRIHEDAAVLADDERAVGAGIAVRRVDMTQRRDYARRLVERHLGREIGMHRGFGRVIGWHRTTPEDDRGRPQCNRAAV